MRYPDFKYCVQFKWLVYLNVWKFGHNPKKLVISILWNSLKVVSKTKILHVACIFVSKFIAY